MTTSVDRADPDGTAITTADPDGTAAVQVTVVGSADPVTVVGTAITADPVTKVGPATMAEAAATAKPHFPAQVTVAAPRLSLLCVMSGSALLDSELRVDLVAHDDAARIGVGLGRVEMIHHVCVADSVLQVDETE
jgi:hypothetical protein